MGVEGEVVVFGVVGEELCELVEGEVGFFEVADDEDAVVFV